MKPRNSSYLPIVLSAMLLALCGYATSIGGGGATQKIEITGFASSADGVDATKNAKKSDPTLRFKLTPPATVTDAGAVTVFIDGVPLPTKAGVTKDVADGAAKLSGLVEGHSYQITFQFAGVMSEVYPITFDTTPPVLNTVKPVYEANGDILLRAEFNEDLKAQGTIDPAQYVDLFIETPIGTFTTAVTLAGKKATISKNRIEINVGKQPRGSYRLSVKANLQDKFDNATSSAVSKDFSIYEPPSTVPPSIELPANLATIEFGVKVSTIRDIQLRVVGVPDRPGTLRYTINGLEQVAVSTRNLSRPITQTVKLTAEGRNSLFVSFFDEETRETKESAPVEVELDTFGPLLEHAELVSLPTAVGTGITLMLTFRDDDLSSPLTPSQFRVARKGAGDALEAFEPQPPEVSGRTVQLPFAALPAGEYVVNVLTTVRDKVGNPAGRQGDTDSSGKVQTSSFSVLTERTFGQHVEFPPFAPPKPQAIPAEGFNPGDYVETRVARLYYYRDAHRVAQIINRNIRSYNQAAVTQAERRAENSRDDADATTDARRKAEREAVRAAEQARKTEKELEGARQALTEAQGAQTAANVASAQEIEIQRQLGNPSLTADQKAALTAALEDVRKRKGENAANVAKFGGPDAIANLAKNVSTLEQSVASLRQNELVRQEEAQGLEAKEERARAKQFRDEVSAAETDPDTYVAGDVKSQDPITQVSISVIGEGLIELRGPIKGINKIRTLLNQIDSPVGQVKIGIFTVQVNGEEGEKMEKVVGDAESNIDLSRFLVNQSLNLLRRAVQSEAAMIAEQCGQDSGHYQVDRDRRYLYSFFGRDFIDELYAMNSEFLNTENTVLSLHAMDTISLNRTLFILALAKNDVRERIVSRFLTSIKSELPDAEFDFRRASELKPHVTEKRFPPWNRTHLPVKNHYHKEDVIYEAVHRNALQRYHFRNFSSFFDTGFNSPDTMNPMQREFIRLAQIFKARLVAEMEYKQRVLERGLIEDRSSDDNYKFDLMKPVHEEAIKLEAEVQRSRIDGFRTNSEVGDQIVAIINLATSSIGELNRFKIANTKLLNSDSVQLNNFNSRLFVQSAKNYVIQLTELQGFVGRFSSAGWLDAQLKKRLADFSVANSTAIQLARESLTNTDDKKLQSNARELRIFLQNEIDPFLYATDTGVIPALEKNANAWQRISMNHVQYRELCESQLSNLTQIVSLYHSMQNELNELVGSSQAQEVSTLLEKSYKAVVDDRSANRRLEFVRKLGKETRADLDHRKLLNHLIDEQEEKFIELVEGTRSHIAVLDDYLKRLSIALEDDFKIQYYDPAFIRVRDAARGQAVNLSQIERTTILTNNRDFAKVDPQATMEFDLPKRQIAIKEAFDAARAVVEDSGALMNDPTFLAAFQMMGGGPQAATVKNVLPTQSSVNEQKNLGFAPPQEPKNPPGSALQSLVPEPSVFKLETGTGFQIRPVMQPDGDSVVYDFDYMYTTNIREPVRADEKHIGRVKRHFVHTAVQTANFEIREISRYQVALKLSRTGQGVPLLQDIPVVGAAFRPAPSAQSSIQQNIILGQTNVYPTLFDLMGLRWAQQVVDLDHTSLMEAEHVIRGRQKSMKDYVFGEASRRVDDFLDVQTKAPNSYRPDFYHPQTLTSPHHPDGYSHPNTIPDPSGNEYELYDRRPADMQDPPYDRYRHQPVKPERIQPQPMSQPFQSQPVPSQPVPRRNQSQSIPQGIPLTAPRSTTNKINKFPVPDQGRRPTSYNGIKG